VRWRGPFETAIYDVSHDAFEVVPNVISRNPQCLDSSLAHPSVTLFIAPRIVSKVVCHSIHFNREASSLAEEIEDERAEGMLPSELKSIWAQPQHSPEPDLRRTHSFA
jgi:hypothetical protein